MASHLHYRRLPRRSLGFFPTPLVELRRLSATLNGPRLWIKRDDQTGLATGGNKTRKLEFLVADALSQKADVLITAGAAQSNHCRQTAAAAAASGLGCHLVLGGTEPKIPTGNYLLDQLFGAHCHWAGEYRKGETIPEVVNTLRAQGFRPYVIPYGGSNELGAAAFVDAFAEVVDQAQAADITFSHIVFASSSGGTHAGLLVGNSIVEPTVELIGIEIDKSESNQTHFAEQIAQIATQTARLLAVNQTFSPGDIHLNKGYVGQGYGIVGELERRAIALTATTEGILLDPVYTGRAMGALIDLIERRQLGADDTVLFWHTGGTPAIFAYAEALTS